MTRLFILISLTILIGCQNTQTSDKSEETYLVDRNLDIKKTIPFSEADNIYVVSFDSQNADSTLTTSDSATTINEKHIKEKVDLNSSHIPTLFKLLYSRCTSGDTISNACYIPRHQILFSNKKKGVFSKIEICFQCNAYKTSLDIPAACRQRNDQLMSLFKDAGIKNFGQS